jgi:hypothetical protein
MQEVCGPVVETRPPESPNLYTARTRKKKKEKRKKADK